MSTCSPMAASAVPRLIAVVVLPTPPFWLAMASTLAGLPAPVRTASSMSSGRRSSMEWTSSGIMASVRRGVEANRIKILWSYLGTLTPLQPTHHDDAGERISAARRKCVIDVPVFASLGQFSVHILPLWEQSEAPAG